MRCMDTQKDSGRRFSTAQVGRAVKLPEIKWPHVRSGSQEAVLSIVTVYPCIWRMAGGWL